MKVLLAIILIARTVSALKDVERTTNTTASGYTIQDAMAKNVIDKHFMDTMAQKGTMDVTIAMLDNPAPILQSLSEQLINTPRADRFYIVSTTLQQHCSASQKPLTDLLDLQSLNIFGPTFSYKSYWVSNVVFIQGANWSLIQTIISLILSIIGSIRESVVVLPMPPIQMPPSDPMPSDNSSEPQVGVKQIGAPEVWATGNRGEGIVVATIDTGVRGTHEALRNNYRPENGWHDSVSSYPVPTDSDGHGTHTMGTIAGQTNGIGVASEATWISCRGCDSEGCSEEALTACGQWMVCPEKFDNPSATTCSGPHVVSNSWGGGMKDSFYDTVINAWIAAGITPVFAAGNSGPNCNTANSPGDRPNVISVGSCSTNNQVSSFSSRGNGSRFEATPSLAAPGENVRSSSNTGDMAYKTLSGTSMATPHVAGVVALLLVKSPNLSFRQVRNALENGSDPTTPIGQTCNGISDSMIPNFQVGYGRTNAVRTLSSV